MRALIDTGASVSLIAEDQYRRLRKRGWMKRHDIEVSQVNGRPKTIRDIANLPVKIGGTQSAHKFYMTPELCEEVILAED